MEIKDNDLDITDFIVNHIVEVNAKMLNVPIEHVLLAYTKQTGYMILCDGVCKVRFTMDKMKEIIQKVNG